MPNIFLLVPYRTHIPFQDGYKNHKGKVASGIGYLSLNAAKPLSLLHPVELSTLGDHIRKERLNQNLSQSEVGKRIGVTTDCITNWELNRFPPRIKYNPKIVEFLGYDPTLKTDENTLGNRVLRYRKEHGLSKKRLAKLWRMDKKTIKRIEKAERIFDKTRKKVINYLNQDGQPKVEIKTIEYYPKQIRCA